MMARSVNHVVATAPPVPADTHSRGARQRHRGGHSGGEDDWSDRRHHDDQTLSRVDAQRLLGGTGARRGEIGRMTGKRRGVERRADGRRRRESVFRVSSFCDVDVTSSTAELASADAAKPPRGVVDVDARRAVQTRRRETVHIRRRRRSVFDFDHVVGAARSRVISATELAQRTSEACRAAARERVQTVNTRSAVQTRSAQLLTVIDVDVTSTSGIAECADAPETIALVDTATCVGSHTTATV